MVERDERFGFLTHDGQEVTPSPYSESWNVTLEANPQSFLLSIVMRWFRAGQIRAGLNDRGSIVAVDLNSKNVGEKKL
jgi:hypothetical protein